MSRRIFFGPIFGAGEFFSPVLRAGLFFLKPPGARCYKRLYSKGKLLPFYNAKSHFGVQNEDFGLRKQILDCERRIMDCENRYRSAKALPKEGRRIFFA